MHKFWVRNYLFVRYVTAIIICLIINLIALTCTNQTYKEGQDRILVSYHKSLAMIDSLQKNKEDALNRVLTERENTIKEILSDTLVDSIQGLCPKQKEAVKKYVRPYLEVTTRELDVKEKIKTDPNHEYKLLRDEIRSLLQLEFNKMQNEYMAIELWAAILTVVFLIFSFYSFFKTEKLEDDGRQSINRINLLEKDARQNLDSLQNKIKDESEKQSRRFSEAFVSQLNDHQSRVREMEDELERRFKYYQGLMDEMNNEIRNIHNGSGEAEHDITDVDQHNDENNNVDE